MWQASRKKPQEAKNASGARWSLFVTLRDGMQQLVDTLATRLSLGTVRHHCAVTAVRPVDENWQLDCEDGSSLQADGVVLATPTFQTARILQALDSELAKQLSSIAYSSAATVSLAYRREQVLHPLNGFGFVVPRIENRAIIACTFSSVKYPGRAPEGYVLLRAFVGGSLQEELFNLDDTEMEHAVRQELGQLLGVQSAPMFIRIMRYPRSMPQYVVGHLRLIDNIERKVVGYPGLAVAGSAYRGVGIADCVRSGEAAAETVFSARNYQYGKGSLRP
jgi:oxygen-dependent protoporphyrinogen oxidase